MCVCVCVCVCVHLHEAETEYDEAESIYDALRLIVFGIEMKIWYRE